MKQRWQLLLKLLLLALIVLATEVLPRLGNLEGNILEDVRPALRFAGILLTLNIALLIFNAFYRRKKGLARGQDDSILLGLRNVYYILTAFFVIAGIIALYGIDFRTLFTSLSIIAAAIAIVTKDVISEILSGLIMSFSGQLSVGDYISVGTTKGKVTTLTLTKVVLLNEDDDLVHLPNSKVFGGELVNYTLRMQRRMSIEFAVAYSAMNSVDDLEKSLIHALDDFADAVVPNSYSLRVVELHKDFADFKFRYTLVEHGPDIERQIRRKTARSVVNYIQNISRIGQAKTSQNVPDHSSPQPVEHHQSQQ